MLALFEQIISDTEPKCRTLASLAQLPEADGAGPVLAVVRDVLWLLFHHAQDVSFLLLRHAVARSRVLPSRILCFLGVLLDNIQF